MNFSQSESIKQKLKLVPVGSRLFAVVIATG